MRVRCAALTLLFSMICGPLLAEDLTGSKQFLCSAIEANMCRPGEGCEGGPPWNTQIPHFIVFDLDKRKIHTTEASHQSRSTEIKTLEREGELIVIQGYELGRAFSFIITEPTGLLTATIATDDGGVVSFGVCTPKVP